MDDQTLLDAVNTQILALLNGGAIKAWGEGGHKVEHMTLSELRAFKAELEGNLAAASGGYYAVREVEL